MVPSTLPTSPASAAPTRTILRLLEQQTPPTAEECDAAVGICLRYPFFGAAAAAVVSRCSNLADPTVIKRLTALAALATADRLALYRLIEPSAAGHASFYPLPQPPKVTTEAAIDTFLDKYGAPIDPEEEAMLEKLIFNPVPDYSSVLESQQGEEAPRQADGQDAVLDAFLARGKRHAAPEASSIEKTEKIEKPEEAPKAASAPGRQPPTPPGGQAGTDSLLSESLAKIYIRRGRYDKAYEIIHNLSLNFPEKSVYFADQLRFLQKLMVNSRYSKLKK